MNYKINKMDVVATKHKLIYSDFADVAATSTTLDLSYYGSNIYLLGVFANVKTAFAGTLTVPQIKVGYPSYTDTLIPLQSIARTGQLKTGMSHQLFCQGMAHPTAKNQAIRLTVQNTTGNLSAYTAGELEIVLVYVSEPVNP
jgi:hypothetical protein